MSQHRIPASHPSLPGHFPGQPVVPGVVILDEVLAAACAQFGPLRLLVVPQVKFLSPLLPEQEFTITLTGALPRLGFECQRGETVLVRGQLQAEPVA